MANAREIKNRINSIQDTMKITNAMYMMSSMKLRKAKQKLEHTEDYFYSLQSNITSMLLHYPDFHHLYFDNRSKDERQTVKRRGIVVITGDKGMAGAYNHNVIKAALKLSSDFEDFHIYAVGEVGRAALIAEHLPVEKDFRYSANNPSIHRARVISEYLLDIYNREELDELYVVYSRMINGIKEDVEVQQLLPLKTHEFLKKELLEHDNETAPPMKNINPDDPEKADDWYLIYPSPKKVLEKLVYNYVIGFMYGALVESAACEENSRMLAMQAATDNAKKILKELSVQYNRIRQAAITQEITEVISGAKALKNKKKKQAR
jgi:F-type H+-transporting ATPase subunit gamma